MMGDFVDVILLYLSRLLYLDCLKFLRLQSLPYRKHSLSELQRSVMGKLVGLNAKFFYFYHFLTKILIKMSSNEERGKLSCWELLCSMKTAEPMDG